MQFFENRKWKLFNEKTATILIPSFQNSGIGKKLNFPKKN